MFMDTDGDVAHEFYEQIFNESTGHMVMMRLHDVKPQVCIYFKVLYDNKFQFNSMLFHIYITCASSRVPRRDFVCGNEIAVLASYTKFYSYERTYFLDRFQLKFAVCCIGWR